MAEAMPGMRVPPHNLQAEQSLLGALMLENSVWEQVADRVRETDFYRQEHQLIFRAIHILAEQDHPFDVITLAEALDKRKLLDDMGGLAYLAEIDRNTGSAVNAAHYARIVRFNSVLRQLIRAGTGIADLAFDTKGRSEAEILDAAEAKVFEIAEQLTRGGGFKSIEDLLTIAVNKIDELYHRDEPITGIPTGFIDFDMKTSGLQPADLIICAGRPSMGKCLEAGSEILLADGRITTIEAIVQERQASLLTLDERLSFRTTQPNEFIDDGHKPVFRVTTRLGRVVDTTVTHPFLTMDGWQALGELAVGDCIAVPRCLPIFGQKPMRDCEVKLLGYLIGDGCLIGPTPKLTNTPPKLQNDFTAAAHAFGRPADVCVVADRAEGRTRRKAFSSALREALDVSSCSQGQLALATHHKFIPEPVFELPKAQLALFLNRLFATDGWATRLASGQCQIGYASVSERLARQVQHLLLRFGVIAKLRYRHIRRELSDHHVWQLELTDADSIRTFATTIGIYSKESALARVMKTFEGQRLQTKLDNQALNDLAPSALYWDPIVSIEPMGLRQVYDLSIPETHNFVANDICVHNTSFAMNVAENVAIKTGKGVAVFSMEMPGDALAMRMMSSLGQIDQHRVRTGKLNEEDWPRLTSAVTMLSQAPMYIDDTPALSPTDLRARVRRLQRDLKREEKELGMIVVDYLQLMQAPSDGENRATEISAISRALKSLAKELHVPVVALSQLNRSLEQRPNKRPVMSDLRESGAIEQDADLIVFIYRDEVYNEDSPDKGVAEIIIGKQRNGPIGTVKLAFLGQFTKFENLAEDLYGDLGYQ
ncbi:replicative DNA helicase [Halochromatium salexigens]